MLRNIYWILLLISFQSFAQDNEWFEYKLHSFANFELPAKKADVVDSIISNLKVYELSAKQNGIDYIGSITTFDQSIMPSNKTELFELYDNSISDFTETFPNTTETKSEIIKDGYHGLKYILSDSNNIAVLSTELYILEDKLLMFYYVNTEKNHPVESDYFFESIVLEGNGSIEQLKGNSMFFKMLNLFKIEILVVLGIIGLGIFLIVRDRKKTA